jgi:hypothetical protein
MPGDAGSSAWGKSKPAGGQAGVQQVQVLTSPPPSLPDMKLSSDISSRALGVALADCDSCILSVVMCSVM